MARSKSLIGRVVDWIRGGGAAAPKRRGYEGARRNRHTDGWTTGSTSADGQITASVAVLRERVRDLVRNNPHAAMAVQVLVNNMVGSGIRPRAKTGNAALNKRVDKLWEAWSRRADAHGHGDIYAVMALAVREMIEGGDCFAMPHFNVNTGRGLPPLQIELREADHLDVAKNHLVVGDGQIRDGIEYDAKGRRVAVWLFDHHPGSVRAFRDTWLSRRYPVTEVAHLFERQRVQSRGVPWCAPSLVDMRHFDDWRNTELIRKKTEACLAGFVVSDEDPADVGGAEVDGKSLGPRVTDSEGNVVEEFSPGMIGVVRGGTDFKTLQPQATGGVGEWSRVQLHAVAAGWRVPYSLMTGDLKENNFASSRVGLNEFRRMVETTQWTCIIPMLLEPIWGWFIQASQLAGLLPDRGDYAVDWATPRFESVNPKQDVDADIAEARAGYVSPQMMIAKRGYDPQAVMDDWKAWAALTDAAGLIFDSDPRRVAKAGTAQPDLPPAGGDVDPTPPPAPGA
jgi:lambda family phage portal protein